MNRTQHVISSGLVALVGVWVAWISWTAQPAAAFVFPRLVATAFVVFALWTFGKAVMGRSRVGAGVSWADARNLAPGLLILIVYAFWAARAFGFYTATTVVFFVLLSLYDPAPHGALRSWIRRVVITACVMLVLYGLFARLLRVYTPREVFF